MHNPSAKLWKKKYFIQKQEVSESSHSPYFLNTMYKSRIYRVSHLEKTCTSVQVKVKVFYRAIICKFIMNVILLCLFMYTGHKQDPSFNSWKNNIVLLNISSATVSIMCLMQIVPLNDLYSVIDNGYSHL